MPDATRRYRRAKGLCPCCGRLKQRIGWVYCPRCRERFAHYTKMRAAKSPLSLGERLRRHRLSLGYTKAAYGVLLGITGDRVGRLEHGTWPWRPSPALQERLADVLGCAVAELGLPVRVQADAADNRREIRMPEYTLPNELLRHLQYILDEQQRLNAKIQGIVTHQQELAAAMLATLAEVREQSVSAAPPPGAPGDADV